MDLNLEQERERLELYRAMNGPHGDVYHQTEKLVAALEEIDELQSELDQATRLIKKQSDLLTRTVNALKGEPPSLTMWSHHDIPEQAERMKARLAKYEKDDNHD